MSLKGIRSKIEMLLLSKGKSIDFIEISEIPKTLEKFLDTDDLWVDSFLNEMEDCSSCIYYAKKGSYFPRHFHNVSEQCCIINKEGKMKVFTTKGAEVVRFPNGAFFPPGEGSYHAIKFLEDTTILIIWRPKFKNGWDAGFIEKKQNK